MAQFSAMICIISLNRIYIPPAFHMLNVKNDTFDVFLGDNHMNENESPIKARILEFL